MIRKKWSILLCSIMLITLFNIRISADDIDQNDSQFQINVIHTNDIHARVQQDERSQILGMGRIKTFADLKKQTADDVLLLDAGDYFHWQSIATMEQGESVAKLMGACGYDALTLGNHDWSYGKEQLSKLEAIVKTNGNHAFSILTGNIINDNGTPYLKNEYLIKEVTNNNQTLKIGIFGVIDPKIYHSTAPNNVEGLVFTDTEAYAKKAVKDLKDNGCQLIIGMTHSYAPIELAKKVDGVNLWIAGHEHLSFSQNVTTPNGSNALVVESGYYLWTIGNVEINCTLDEQGKITYLDMKEHMLSYEEGLKLTSDASIEALIQTINEDQLPILKQKVGYSPIDLDGVWEHVRTQETTLGRAITNAYRMETNADVAFENAGGIRSSIQKGEVTYQNVLDVSPYGNYVVTKSLSGKELLSMMETSLDIMKQSIAADESGEYDAWPAHSGSMLQMSGMKIEYDFNKPKGSRIVRAQIHDKDVLLEAQYLVAMNNYVATDTKTYPELSNKENVHEYGACEDILASYLSQEATVLQKDLQTIWFHKYVPSAMLPQEKAPETSDTSHVLPLLTMAFASMTFLYSLRKYQYH